MKDIATIAEQAKEEIAKAHDAPALEDLRVRYLGRKGAVTALLRTLKDMPLEERRSAGPLLQGLARDIESMIEERASRLGHWYNPAIDMTAPGLRGSRAHLHPLTLAEREIRGIFHSLNFSAVEGPEVESEYFNFEALNFPPNHPARDTQDTFWMEQAGREKLSSRQRYLLRTQVTAIQIHHLERITPPFQIVYTGRTYRYEASDAGHEINFYQTEAMAVGRDLSLANFKYVIEEFLTRFFGKGIEFRYRPSYFPFVEPGLEVDVKFRGKWFEIMGAGMVHQRVFEYAHYNPGEWQGFAFGMGLDRLAMIKYGIPDIRLFYSGDLRFIKQF
jgi:phenylalanyl-tRNA synthetase alpha chain